MLLELEVSEKLVVSVEELGVSAEDPMILFEDPMMVDVEEHLVEEVVLFVSFRLWKGLLAFEELLVSFPLIGRTKSRE